MIVWHEDIRIDDMVHIGLIADTHIPEAGEHIPDEVYKAFKGVDMILHGGDTHVIEVLDWLETIAPLLCARGNGDYPHHNNANRPGLPEDPRVQHTHTLEVEGINIGLIHGFPLPHELPYRTQEELLEMHFDCDLDVIVCGDTHEARIDTYPGLTIINPGSPTLPNQIKGLGTVAFLDIIEGHINPYIVQLQDI